MKRFLIITLLTTAFVGAILLTLFVKTTTANADIAAGNKAYAAQDYETALQRYTAAQSQAPGQVEPAYNAANTYYRRNVLDKAQQTLEPTLAQPNNVIAEFVHFNLGNIAYKAKQFDAAIAQYEATLRLQPSDRDAKYNLELALQQKQQQQDQQNQQQQQNQDQQNQQQQNQDQQKQDQQNQQNQSDQQNQSGGQQDQQQKQPDQQNGQLGDQQDQQQNQPDQQNQQQQNQSEQQNDQRGDQQNQQQDQQQGQQAGQPDQPQFDQQNGQAYGARPQQGLTPEQAKRLLAAIGGNSRTLMEQLQLIYIVPGGNPDKDW
jgi:Ca-activated chloride channel family protein